MARKLDPKITITNERLVEAYNDLCQSHNDLCLAHDELVYQFQEVQKVLDQIVDVVFATTAEYDS